LKLPSRRALPRRRPAASATLVNYATLTGARGGIFGRQHYVGVVGNYCMYDRWPAGGLTRPSDAKVCRTPCDADGDTDKNNVDSTRRRGFNPRAASKNALLRVPSTL